MNDGAACFGFLLVAVAIVVFIVVIQVQKAEALRGTYRRLAKRYRGDCHYPSLFDHPTVRFKHHNAFALVDI
ncbi:MAG: hypothetical protein CMJ64_20300 [Planctomycetaceae bacterium]|nr:hypothetical protein [Planctomycetaceae bacterium]